MARPAKFLRPTPRNTLVECIELVKGVSWRAMRTDFYRRTDPRNPKDPVSLIERLETHRSTHDQKLWWRTWYRESNNAIDVVVFFQKMKHRGDAYSLCIGFKPELLPDPDDLNTRQAYINFLDWISDKGNDDGLHNFVKTCLEVDFVYLVDLPRPSHDRHEAHDAKRDELLEVAINYYVNHPEWKISDEGSMQHRHWRDSADTGYGIIYKLSPIG